MIVIEFLKFEIGKKYLISIVLMCILCGVLGYIIGDRNAQITVQSNSENIIELRKNEEEKEDIDIYIVGCIKQPGVYKIQKDTIVNDVVNLAGGFTEQADIENINLVYKLKNNVMIKIKSKDESLMGLAAKCNGMDVIKSINNDNQDNDIDVKVDINIATREQLTKLPGVGASMADRIISYREQVEGFQRIEDIMNVSGIGENKFNNIREFIIVN